MASSGRSARRSKYGNVRTSCDGIQFDSLAEARRYSELKLLEKAGIVRRLSCHPVYRFVVGTIDVGGYEADFSYEERGAVRLDGIGWDTVVEDVKGVRTAVYRLKKKLMLACHGIEIRETKGGR